MSRLQCVEAKVTNPIFCQPAISQDLEKFTHITDCNEDLEVDVETVEPKRPRIDNTAENVAMIAEILVGRIEFDSSSAKIRLSTARRATKPSPRTADDKKINLSKPSVKPTPAKTQAVKSAKTKPSLPMTMADYVSRIFLPEIKVSKRTEICDAKSYCEYKLNKGQF